MHRRQLLNAVSVSALTLPLGNYARAADFDLIIQGGRIIDPANGYDELADLAIRNGKIALINNTIASSRSVEVIDAKGMIVAPGLIDVHVHARDAELPPEVFLSTGVTSMVDAGSRGADNIDQLVDIAREAPNRMRIMLNIAELGNNPDGRAEFLDGIAPADINKAIAAVERHQEWIVGIKARLSRGVSGKLDAEVLRRAIAVATPFKLPVMIHIGDTASSLPTLLQQLRPGDIVTHMYAPTSNGILDSKGYLIDAVKDARERGIRFDFGNGLNEHWAWEIAEKALDQDFIPDTISSDLNVPGRHAQVFNLPNVMSKFLLMGMSLIDVLNCATYNSAQSFQSFNELGTLKIGAPADITLLELNSGVFEYEDNYQGMRLGNQKLTTRSVLMGGRQSA